jgi:hypothetical protein
MLLGVQAPPNWGPVQLIDVRAPEPTPTAGPVRINLKEPGFEKLSVTLDVPSTRDGLILQTLAMTPRWEELGELTVVLKGWDEHVGDLAEQPFTSLDLKTDEGARQHVYLKDIADGRPFDGKAAFLVGFAEGSYAGAGDSHHFDGPPYRIPFVSLHKWRVILQTVGGYPAGKSLNEGPVVELSAGENGSVRVEIPGS